MNIQLIGNGNVTSDNFNASFLINNNILVDTPPGMLKELKKMNKDLDNIDIIIITHLHGDHYFDLPFIIYHEYMRKRTKNLVIIGPKDLKKKLIKLLNLAFYNANKYLSRLNIMFINSLTVQNKEIGDDLYLSSVILKHANLKENYGFILKNKDKSLGFTGDTEMCPGLTYIIKESRVCIVDVDDNQSEKHLRINQLKSIAENSIAKIIPIHYPDSIKKDLENIKNIKLIDVNEQFFI